MSQSTYSEDPYNNSVGIIVLVGDFSKIIKRSVWNKRSVVLMELNFVLIKIEVFDNFNKRSALNKPVLYEEISQN